MSRMDQECRYSEPLKFELHLPPSMTVEDAGLETQEVSNLLSDQEGLLFWPRLFLRESMEQEEMKP